MADTDRNNKGQFTTGNTCGGRKRIPKDFLDAVLSYTSEALQTIIEIMQNQKAPNYQCRKGGNHEGTQKSEI